MMPPPAANQWVVRERDVQVADTRIGAHVRHFVERQDLYVRISPIAGQSAYKDEGTLQSGAFVMMTDYTQYKRSDPGNPFSETSYRTDVRVDDRIVDGQGRSFHVDFAFDPGGAGDHAEYKLTDLNLGDGGSTGAGGEQPAGATAPTPPPSTVGTESPMPIQAPTGRTG